MYSHGSGVTSPQVHNVAIDCEIRNVEMPINWDSQQRNTVKRLRAYNATSCTSYDTTDFTDCVWIIKRDDDANQPSSNGVFFQASGAVLNNCFVGGGSPTINAGTFTRILWHNTSVGITLNNTTVATVATSSLNSAGLVNINGSIWPGASANVGTSTNSYVWGVTGGATPDYDNGPMGMLRLKYGNAVSVARIGCTL